MPLGLLDIADATLMVPVDGGEVEVRGVDARGIAYLLQRFPELGALISGGDNLAGDLMGRAPEAIASIIAIGCGYAPGEVDAEESLKALRKAERLPVHLQAELLGAIVQLTMPHGLVPFVEKLGALFGVLSGAPDGKGPDTNSPKPSLN